QVLVRLHYSLQYRLPQSSDRSARAPRLPPGRQLRLLRGQGTRRSGAACYSPTTSGNRSAPPLFRVRGELWLVPPGAVFLTFPRGRGVPAGAGQCAATYPRPTLLQWPQRARDPRLTPGRVVVRKHSSHYGLLPRPGANAPSSYLLSKGADLLPSWLTFLLG